MVWHLILSLLGHAAMPSRWPPPPTQLPAGLSEATSKCPVPLWEWQTPIIAINTIPVRVQFIGS